MYHFIHFMQTIQKLSIGGILLCEDDIRIITYDHCVGVIRVAPTYVNDSHRGNGWFRLGQSTPKRIGDVESNRWAAHLPGRTSSLALQAEAKGEMSQESNDHVLLYYTVLIPPNPYQWKILWKIISIYRCYRWWSEASWAPHSLSLVVYDGQRCYAQQYPSTKGMTVPWYWPSSNNNDDDDDDEDEDENYYCWGLSTSFWPRSGLCYETRTWRLDRSMV